MVTCFPGPLTRPGGPQAWKTSHWLAPCAASVHQGSATCQGREGAWMTPQGMSQPRLQNRAPQPETYSLPPQSEASSKLIEHLKPKGLIATPSVTPVSQRPWMTMTPGCDQGGQALCSREGELRLNRGTCLAAQLHKTQLRWTLAASQSNAETSPWGLQPSGQVDLHDAAPWFSEALTAPRPCCISPLAPVITPLVYLAPTSALWQTLPPLALVRKYRGVCLPLQCWL